MSFQIFGKPEDCEAYRRKITVSQNSSARAQYGWKSLELEVVDLINMTIVPLVGVKDGTCVTQGELVGDRRLSKSVRRNHILLGDNDVGTPFDKVVEKAQASGKFVFGWSTYSHMGVSTEVAESRLVQHAKKLGVDLNDDGAILSVGSHYLSTVKKIETYIIETLAFDGRVLEEGGVVYKFTHCPMPRFRFGMVLNEPFDFIEGGTQAENINAWKKDYADTMDEMGLPWDSSCTDPARLMYLPRVPTPEALAHFQAFIVAGETVSLRKGASRPLTGAHEIAARFTNPAGSVATVDKKPVPQTKTPGVAPFVLTCDDFDAVAAMETLTPDIFKSGGPPNGRHIECPTADLHTHYSPDDTACFVSTNDEGWNIVCLHASCKAAWNNDRIIGLDEWMAQHGIKVQELRQFSAKAVAEDRAAQSVRVAASNPDALQALIATLTPQSSDSEVDLVLASLAAAGDRALSRHAKTVSLKIGGQLSAADVKKEAKALAKKQQDAAAQQARVEAAEDGVTLSRHPVPEDLERASAIWLDWPANIIKDATFARLKHVNERKPFLFRRREGGIIRITHDVDGRAMAQAVTADEWAAILADHVTYQREDPLTGVVSVVPTPGHIIQILKGTDALQFPELRTINRIPLFDEDGELITARGYVPSLKIYLDPDMDFIAPSKVPTEDEVWTARAWIDELKIDFPLCDYTDSDMPIYLEARDVDDHPKPNLKRGVASRANFDAMLLLPQMRHLIDGPTPAYHVDKPAAGTGAGFLVDAVYCVTEGTRAEIQTLSGSKEEVRKNITATLRNGRPIIFFDNVAGDLDSTDLAAMITSGVWRDRILGKSETVTMDVQAMVIIAGNNVRMSAELMRRMVPVYMDAGVDDPAFNRRPDSFKHNPLQKWIIEHRRELIWACHTLIANWFAKGKPVGTVGINSFTEWSQVMSGVLAAAGIPGFLDNVPAYLSGQGPDAQLKRQVTSFLVYVFGSTEFTAGEALAALHSPPMQYGTVETPWGEFDTLKFSRWLSSNLSRGVIDIDADAKLHQTLVGSDVHVLPSGRRVYRFKAACRSASQGLKYRFSSIKRPENVAVLLTKLENSGGSGDVL